MVLTKRQQLALGDDFASIRRGGLAIALMGTCLGMIQAVRMGMPSDLGGGEVPLRDALVRSLGIWWLWALLAPIVFVIARRWHPERVGLRRSVVAHAVGAVAVSLVHSLVYVPAILALVWPHLLPRLYFVWRVNLVGNIAGDLVPYAAIAGLFYAVDYYRRNRAGSAGTATAIAPLPPVPWLERIAVRAAGRVRYVPVGEMDSIQGSGDYALLHCGDRRHLADERLAALATLLDPALFVRVHRSAIVRVDQVREVRRRSHGDSDIVLAGGRVLRSSRTYRSAVTRALEGRRSPPPTPPVGE
jgi:hypothetical protein